MAWGLARIKLYERLGERAGRRLSRPARRRAKARAARRVRPLERWDQIPERAFRRYSTGGSAVRVSRLLDLIDPGERILDIGVGHGYIAGVLIRDLAPRRYCGVDLRESFAESTRAMLAANDLAGPEVEIVVDDVFELGDSFWRRQDPDVVLMLEMLEHVTDPGRALRGVASAVKAGTRIIWTVPLPGHLDSVWGHRSTFDATRLRRLCAAAGLRPERIEPLQATWALVVARTSGQPEAGPQEPDPRHTFVRLRGRRRTDEGAVRLEVVEPRILRLDISAEGAGDLRLAVIGRDREGVARLEWRGPAPAERTTYVLRPGQAERDLAPGRGSDPDGVDSVDVVVEGGGSGEASATVHRVAYVRA